MSITIETAADIILAPSEGGELDDGDVVPEPLPTAPVPSDSTLTITKMDTYDEDLNANPFFQSFMVSCPDLFSQCVLEQWIICIPRRDSLPKYAFTLEDFAHHILRPLPSKVPLRRQLSGESDGICSSCPDDGDQDQPSFLSSGRCSSGGSVVSEDSFQMNSPSISSSTAFLSPFSSILAMGNQCMSRSSSSNLKGNWNYRTLSHVNVEYSGHTLILDIEVPIVGSGGGSVTEVESPSNRTFLNSTSITYNQTLDSSGIGIEDTFSSFQSGGGFPPSNHLATRSDSNSNPTTPKSLLLNQNRVQLRKEVLFEETFYTSERQKYKVLCVASPLNSKVDIEDENFGNQGLGLWNLTSLRDCIDFLWVKGSPKLLTTFDSFIKHFQNNHRGLENFPLKVQKDVVQSLYLKCLNYAITNGGIVSPEASPGKAALNDFFLQRLKLSTETYVLNGIYRSVISAITSYVSGEDSKLNKVMRNLTELHPQDLDIRTVHWDNLGRARQELGRLNSYSSPLGKLTCMKRTLRYLRPDTFPESGSASTSGEGNYPLSADELIPIWVYLLVKNPLGNWMAQLEFLRHFRFSTEASIGIAGQNFQTNLAKDNENSFYITTLEASLEHLRSGKVLGISDSDKDLGMPCDLGEAWLHHVHLKAMESSDSPLGEMFDVIRLGNCLRLEELIEGYEHRRQTLQEELETRKRLEKESKLKSKKSSSGRSLDLQRMCHPLCQCDECVRIIRITFQDTEDQEDPVIPPAIELKTCEGLGLLHVACIYGRPRIVEYLIDVGADLEAQDIDGMTPLHFAASRGHQNALLLLLDAGSSLEPRNISLNTPLHLAAQNGHEGCVKALIYDAERCGKKLHISSRNQKGDTALHFASRWGFQGICQILVEHGAAIRVHNIRHVTPLDCSHDIHILKILQRSLRRRSLVEVNHGDFINIEMVQKEGTGGIVMLITEPKDPPQPAVKESPLDSFHTPHTRSGQSSRSPSLNPSRVPSRVPSRRTSVTALPDLVPATSTPLPSQSMRSRKTSSIISPMKGINEETSHLLQDVAEHLLQDNLRSNNYLSVVTLNPSGDKGENEHLRKISVQSLEECRSASAESAFAGLITFEDTKERDIRKVFTAIQNQDFPLALFYLGIPAEELQNPENEDTPVTHIPSCHPLCPCVRCVAKNAGLGLGLDVKNEEGFTPLHAAVEMGFSNLVKILIRFGADVNCQSESDKKTPLDVAKEKGWHDLEDVLEACGAKSTTSFVLESKEAWGTQ